MSIGHGAVKRRLDETRRFSLLLIAAALGCWASACSDLPNAGNGGDTVFGDGDLELCPPRGPAESAAEPLSAERQVWFSTSLPQAKQLHTVVVPRAMLTENDVTYGNDDVWSLLDESCATVGYARKIFTPISCVGGECLAVRFVLVFDDDAGFLDIFHPPGTTHDFMKFLAGAYEAFSAADRELLRSILADPPPDLLEVTSYEELVEGPEGTIPTKVEYQDDVVRGAAFTTYVALLTMLDTQSILREIFDL